MHVDVGYTHSGILTVLTSAGGKEAEGPRIGLRHCTAGLMCTYLATLTVEVVAKGI